MFSLSFPSIYLWLSEIEEDTICDTMLQWMGGSRRKVITSRNSTHKRQKQYFEQRKRQQQTAGLESYADGKHSCTQHGENNRSLDILGLENISSLGQEHGTSHLIEVRDNSGDDDDDDFTLFHQNACHPPSICAIEVSTVDQSERNKKASSNSIVSGISSSCHSEAGKSKKVLVRLTDPKEDLAGNGNKLDHLKLSTAQQISVIDLLGDCGAKTKAEELSVHAQEAHVSFSVEGLGKVEAETPVQSPEMPGRSFLKGYSSPKATRRQVIASKQLDYGFNDLESQVDVDFSPHASSIKQLFCSRDIMDVVGNPNQPFSNFQKSSPFNWNDSSLKSGFPGDELFYSSRECSRNFWNAGPSFLDENIDDLGEYEPFCKNWVDQRDVGYDDYFNNKVYRKQDFNFADWNLLDERFSSKRTESFDMTESTVPYPKHQILEDPPDFKIADTKYSTIGADNDVNRFLRDDTRESLSRLSEESCSSTAVRGDATKKP